LNFESPRRKESYNFSHTSRWHSSMSNSISYSERDSSSCHHNSNYSSGEESKTHSLSTNSPQECEYKRSRSSLDDDCTLDWGDNSFLAKASPQIRRFRHLHDEEKGRHEHIVSVLKVSKAQNGEINTSLSMHKRSKTLQKVWWGFII
jgi:hypothetical protein